MEHTFLNSIKRYITPDFVQSLSMNSTDSRDNIQKAYDLSIPAILMQLGNKSEGNLQSIIGKVKTLFGNDSSDYVTRMPRLSSLLEEIFGTSFSGLQREVSNHAGISATTSESVLKTSLLGIFDYFKELSADFNVGTIRRFLTDASPRLGSLLPASMATMFAATSHNAHATHVDNINQVVNENTKNQYKTNESPYNERNNGGGGWKYALLALLLGAGLLYWLSKSCNKDKEVVTTETTQDTVKTDNSTTTTTTTTTTKKSVDVKLADNTVLKAYEGGIEEQLIAFLNAGEYKTWTEDQLKEKWFNFDYLNFEHDSATIKGDTKVQLDNLAAILKAYPDVKFKVGGYTDKTGNEDYNKKLSGERAMAVKTYLTEKGLGDRITGAEGYGSDFAKYPATASEEERLTDRRVALRISK